MDGTTPAAGVVVTATSVGGKSAVSALSEPSGAFLLRLGPGTYQLRALKIGFRPTIVDRFVVTGDSIQTHHITLVELPVAISRIVVRGKNDCSLRGRDGEAFLQLWEQARGALIATRLGEMAGTLDVHVVTITGHVDALAYYRDSRSAPLRASHTESDSAGAREFVSNRVASSTPAETLMAQGYVRRRSGGSFVFDMPPPEALISDEFAANYCFRVVDGGRERRNWIGVEFAPRSTRDSVVDIQGVLWVERSTSELRRLEFEYTNLPAEKFELCDPDPDPRMSGRATGRPSCMSFPLSSRLGLGGDADYVRLADGAWLTSRFTIRMPPDAFKWRPSGNRTAQAASGGLERCSQGPRCMDVWLPWPRLVTTTGTVVSVKYSGSERFRNDSALAVIATAVAKRAGNNPAQVFGVVANADGRPLVNAIVEVEDPGRVGYTDSAGAFAVRLLPAGQVVITAKCRGYQPVRIPLTLQPGASHELRLSLSSSAEGRAPRDCSTGS